MSVSSFLGLLVVSAGVVAVMALWRWWARHQVTVWAWEAGLLYRDGRFVRALAPGRYLSGLGGTVVVRVSTRRAMLVIPAQDVLTADSFSVKIGVVLEWSVADARTWHEAAEQGRETLHVAAQAATRMAAAARTLDELIALRGDAGAWTAATLPAIAAAAVRVGAVAEDFTLRDLVLPAEIRRMVTEVERARREGLAALERARGEHAALRSLANAARLMRGNPELQTLRTLQALAGQPGRPAPTLVLGAPGLIPLSPGPEQPPDATPN